MSVLFFPDSLGQLVRENNEPLDKTIIYEYDSIGNVSRVKEYDYSLSNEPTSSCKETVYAYDQTHRDRLTSYNGESITYNSYGYPDCYQGKIWQWERGKLKKMYRGSDTQVGSLYEECSFTYDGYGRRTRKYYSYDPKVGISPDGHYYYETTYEYDSAGRLICENCTEYRDYNAENVTRQLTYLYDESGMIGVCYSYKGASPVTYYYRRNLQGDVVAMYRSDGTLVALYSYDAYGNCIQTPKADYDIALYNPIRYRGYYYDRETKLYYLNARYYNPSWRRFISPSLSSINPQRVNGLNLYSYASNEPVNIQYNTATHKEVDFSREAVSQQPSVIPTGTTSLGHSGFAFPTLSFNSLLKNTLLSLSEVSGTLSFSLTKHGRAMIDYHRFFDGIDGFTTLDNLPHPVNTLFKYVGVGLMAIDTIGAGIESYYLGHSFGQGTLNVILTGGKNYAVYQVGSYVTTAVGTWAGAKLGASIGSWAGPVGLAVGVVSGAFIGYLIDEFGNEVIDWIVGWFD